MEHLVRIRDALISFTSNLDRSTVWAAAVGILISVLAFNFLQTNNKTPAAKDGQPATPCEHPSLIPFFGHVPQLALCQEWFLHRLRALYPEGIFSLRLFGGIHSFVFNPSFASTVLSKPRGVASNEFLSPLLLHSNFGMSRSDTAAYGLINDEITDLMAAMLLAETGLNELVSTTVRCIKRDIVDLVTFNSSPADQTDWEVAAGAEVVQNSKGESFVEVDLMELVRNFVAKTANPGLMGSNFVDNFPDAWQHIWKFDAAFLKLIVVPSWIPWPGVGLARAAVRSFRAYAHEYHEALDKYLDGQDPGPRWQDLHDISAFQRERLNVFRRVGLPYEVRAGAELAQAWAMNANSNPLVSWMLWEMARDAVLVEQIRQEIAPHVRVTQPDNEFGSAVWVAPELEHIDVNALLTKCPLLKGAYIETLRLYTGSWAVKRTMKDFTHLHQLDPEYYPDPLEFHPERHIRETRDERGNLVRTADMGTIKAYSGGTSMCKGRAFALREMMVYPAVFLSFYDFVAPEGKGWEKPKTEKRAATRHPLRPMTVWVRRRRILKTAGR